MNISIKINGGGEIAILVISYFFLHRKNKSGIFAMLYDASVTPALWAIRHTVKTKTGMTPPKNSSVERFREQVANEWNSQGMEPSDWNPLISRASQQGEQGI